MQFIETFLTLLSNVFGMDRAFYKLAWKLENILNLEKFSDVDFESCGLFWIPGCD